MTATATPNPTASEGARASAGRRIRHHTANLVAVIFYRRGDLLRALDTLNGVHR